MVPVMPVVPVVPVGIVMPVGPMRTDGAWEKKKVSHAPNRDKRGSQGREKGRERGMGEEKSFPYPES